MRSHEVPWGSKDPLDSPVITRLAFHFFRSAPQVSIMSRSRITSLDRSDYEPLGLRKEKPWQGHGTPEFLEEDLDLKPRGTVGSFHKWCFNVPDVPDEVHQSIEFHQKFHCKQLAAPRQAHKVSVMHRERLGPAAGLKPLFFTGRRSKSYT